MAQAAQQAAKAGKRKVVTSLSHWGADPMEVKIVIGLTAAACVLFGGKVLHSHYFDPEMRGRRYGFEEGDLEQQQEYGKKFQDNAFRTSIVKMVENWGGASETGIFPNSSISRMLFGTKE